MSTYYYHWMTILAERDANMARLGIMALAITLAWVSCTATYPASWVPWIKRVYIAGGLGLYAVTILIAFGGL